MRAAVTKLALAALTVCGPAAVGCRTTGPGAEATLKVNGNNVGALKGYTALNHQINERLIDHGAATTDTFQLGSYLGQGGGSGGVLPLLGAYGGEVANSGFINGVPNALNALLWNVALGRLADDLSGLCATPPKTSGSLKVTANVRTLLIAVCAWPQPAAQDRLQDLWLAVMGFDAPLEEFQGWQTQVGTGLAPLSGGKALRALLITMFMNPYFLLET